MNKKIVNISHLMEVKKRDKDEPEFDLFAIADEAKQLYEAVCTIGLNEVEVCYEENGKMQIKQASMIYPYYRAIAVVIMYLKGFELKRLEKIFNLLDLVYPNMQGIEFTFNEEEMKFIKEAQSIKDFFDKCFVVKR